MNRWILIPLLVVGGVFGVVVAVGATSFDGNPKILLHVTDEFPAPPCAAGSLTDCRSAKSAGSLAPPVSGVPLAGGHAFYIYLLAARGNGTGISSMVCGISYQSNQPGNLQDNSGIDVLQWQLCADAMTATGAPNAWPAPLGGALIQWTTPANCQTGDVAVGGFFYVTVYSSDQMGVTPHPGFGVAAVLDCGGVPQPPLNEGDLGLVNFNPAGVGGCNPCRIDCASPVPAPVTTWSSIKTLSN